VPVSSSPYPELFSGASEAAQKIKFFSIYNVLNIGLKTTQLDRTDIAKRKDVYFLQYYFLLLKVKL
jgi:hypothetical protein